MPQRGRRCFLQPPSVLVARLLVACVLISMECVASKLVRTSTSYHTGKRVQQYQEMDEHVHDIYTNEYVFQLTTAASNTQTAACLPE